MPFKSKSQQRFMFAKHPKIAEEFAEATPSFKKLPEHVNKMAQGGYVDNPVDKEKEERSSPNWEEIKNFVGGANREPKNAIQQELDRLNQRNPQNMQEGGLVEDQQPDDVLRGTMNPTQIPPGHQITPQIASQTPSDESYNQQASQIMGGITPQNIQDYVRSLDRNQRMGQIGAGIAGIGDAIASVGGKEPGHMRATEEMLQQNREQGLKLPGEIASIGKGQYEMSQELQKNSANSPLAKQMHDAFRNTPIGRVLGSSLDSATPNMMAQLTGTNIEQLKNEAQEKEARALHEQTGRIQELSLAQQKANQEAERAAQLKGIEQKGKENKVEAAKDVVKNYSINPLNPITRDQYKKALAIIESAGESTGNEVVRMVKGKPAIFDSETKTFKRWQ